VGKYLLLNQHDLEWTERFFNRRAGTWTLFAGRFIPVVRHFISIPAGTGRMPLPQFLVATLVGATLWNTFLLVCGMKLRERWQVILEHSHEIDIGVVVVLGLGGAAFLIHRLQRHRRTAPDTQQP
jgi:membrane protein DedA with SNARE-associated domain